MQRAFTILPYGGLCNRMNVTAAAGALTQLVPCNVEVIWAVKPWCNAKFEELFQPLHVPHLKLRDVKHLSIAHQRSLPRNLRLAGTLRSIRGIQNIEDYYPHEAQPLVEMLTNKRRVYLSSCQRFTPITQSLRTLFIPQHALAERIAALTAQFSPQTFGFHIRRGDHTHAIQASPLEAFVACMEQLADEVDEAAFYVATDDLQVKQTLKQRFGKRIISYDAQLKRSTKAGMQDALIELFALSNTKGIWGSMYSSYSEVAAELGNIPLKLITQT